MPSYSVDTIWARSVGLVHSASMEQIACLALITTVLVSILSRSGGKNMRGVPLHGRTYSLEPMLLLQSKFVMGAREIIASGYQKVNTSQTDRQIWILDAKESQFKDVPFIISRFDTDYNILPIKYLEELRLVPSDILSGKMATAQNMLYKWTDLHFLETSNLHASVLKRKLTPQLSKFLEIASKEVDYAWDTDVPQSDDWIEVDIQELARTLVARMSARIFLGEPACRDPEWLRVCLDFTMDAFITAFFLRMFPTWMRFIVAPLLPSRWRLGRYRAKAQEVVGARKKTYMDAVRRREAGEAVEVEDVLMNWMLDNGTEQETTIAEMANRQLAMTLASVHTTSTNTAIFLFELCAHPEYFPMLREEIEEVDKKLGKFSESNMKQWQVQLERMDSFLLECFRVHPPILLNPQRVALQDWTLKDGTHIPKGCRVAFANAQHQNDPEITPDPATFDPMRSYRKRHSSTAEFNKHQAVLTDINNNLTFGYGNQACPGRFLGVAEVKMLLAKLLSEFDFKYPEGKSVPKTLSADENVFIDPSAKLMMRKRIRT